MSIRKITTRKEPDLSQANIASLLGVSESSVRAWENNRSKSSLAGKLI